MEEFKKSIPNFPTNEITNKAMGTMLFNGGLIFALQDVDTETKLKVLKIVQEDVCKKMLSNLFTKEKEDLK